MILSHGVTVPVAASFRSAEADPLRTQRPVVATAHFVAPEWMFGMCHCCVIFDFDTPYGHCVVLQINIFWRVSND